MDMVFFAELALCLAGVIAACYMIGGDDDDWY